MLEAIKNAVSGTAPDAPETTDESLNKEFIIEDINGTEIGTRTMTPEGDIISEVYFVQIKMLDGTVTAPDVAITNESVKYIQFEDTDGALRFSPEPTPEDNENIDPAAETAKMEEETIPEEEVSEKTTEEKEFEDRENAVKSADDKELALEIIEKLKDKIPDSNPFKLSIVKLLDEVVSKI